MIGTLGCAAACAGLLGIESPAEPGATGDAGDGSVLDVDGTAADRAAGDAAPPAEADGHDSGAVVGDGAADDDAVQGDAEPPLMGILCGTGFCELGLVCCYRDAMTALGCMTSMECTQMAGRPAYCDGDEDCAGMVCCASLEDGGVASFSFACVAMGACTGVLACHPGTTECNCKRAGPCLPRSTCDGSCT
jgi:hypothetical protein